MLWLYSQTPTSCAVSLQNPTRWGNLQGICHYLTEMRCVCVCVARSSPSHMVYATHHLPYDRASEREKGRVGGWGGIPCALRSCRGRPRDDAGAMAGDSPASHTPASAAAMAADLPASHVSFTCVMSDSHGRDITHTTPSETSASETPPSPQCQACLVSLASHLTCPSYLWGTGLTHGIAVTKGLISYPVLMLQYCHVLVLVNSGAFTGRANACP